MNLVLISRKYLHFWRFSHHYSVNLMFFIRKLQNIGRYTIVNLVQISRKYLIFGKFLLTLFRAERGLSSRSSGLGSTWFRSVLENFCTIQPSNHPTTQPSNKRYTIYAGVSPKFLKPTKYFKGYSFVKLKMISIFGENGEKSK